jgi:monomeric sarcosine oxidase
MIYDAIVLGTGGVGSAALYHLAKRGARTLGIDRFPGGHDRGSSHGDTRIIRLAYFEHPDYVPLLRRAYQLWAELERTVDERLYHQVGLLEAGPLDGELVPGVLRCAREHQLDLEPLDAAAVARRYPGFRLPEGCQAVFERQAGFLRVERCVLAHLRAAAACGAEHRTGIDILGWRRETTPSAAGAPGVITVETTRGPVATRRLVITPGAWAPELLAGPSGRFPAPFRVLRKHLHWFQPRTQDYAGPAGCAFFFELPWGMFYGFPPIDELGVKVANHAGGEQVVQPLGYNRSLDIEDRQLVETFVGAYMPGLSRSHRRHATCLYTMTPDGHFIVDRHPECDQVVLAAGLSGHGFKFASVLGETLATWALDGAPGLPVEFLGLNRFAGTGA